MKNFYTLFVTLLISSLAFGQIAEDFNTGLSTSYFTGNRTLTSGSWSMQAVVQENTGNSRSGFAARINDDVNGAHLTTPSLNGAGTLSFWYRELNSGGGTFEIQTSTDGTNYTTLTSQSFSGTTFTQFTFNINDSSSNLTIRILNDDQSGHLIIDDLVVTALPSGPDNPDAFSASILSSSQIDLIYDDNTAGDNVVIVFDTDDTFTAPTGAPGTVGSALAGGTILFNGSGSGTYNHTSLTENTTYYYMAYSYDGVDYSTGLSANETTPCNAIAVTALSPFQEGFEAGVPPSCWASYRGSNGLGTAQDWQLETTDVNSGTNAAFVRYEDVSGGNAEDWLVTPALDLSSLTNTELSFFTRDEDFVDASDYSVRVSTLSQTDQASFTTINTNTSYGDTYTNEIVDLSAYDGQIVYIAFVMSQDNGDSWYIDDIEVKEGTSKDANIIETGFDEQDNIDYTLFDDVTSALDDTNAIKIGEFSIQDAGGAPADIDALTTTLTDISFDITGFANIAAIALIDDTEPVVVNLAETSTVTATTTFSGLSIQADDDGSKIFSVYVTFDNANITDNDQIQLTISAATADNSGSVFANANAGGAQTTINGDDNRIEVTATDLIIGTDTSNVEVNTIMSPSLTVTAVDAEANTDLDVVTVTLTPSVAGIFDVTASFVDSTTSGTATFDNLIFDTTGTGYTLTASSGALTTDTSAAFDVTEAVVLTTTIVAIEDFDSSTPNWTNDISSQTFVDPSSPSEGLFIQAASTNNLNFSGNTAFGRDLEGESGEPSLSPYTFTFDPVTITGLTSVNVSFDYHAFANAEIGEYEIFIDGVGQGSVEYFNDPDTSPGVNGTISVDIPDGNNTVGLVLTGTLNGEDDVLELDNFTITSTSISTPTCNTFAGNGLTGFGDVLGTGSLEVCAISGTTIDFTFTKGSGNFNNDDYMVIYIDSQSGGITDTANLTDTGDPGRQAISGFDGSSRSTLDFPTGFEPDFAIALDNNFAGLFEIVESGSHTFIQDATLSPTATPTAATYTFNIDFTNINTSIGAESLKVLATYLNPDGAFRSNEAIGRMNTVGNPGANPVGMDTYYQSNSGLQGGIAPSTADGLWSDGASWTNGNAPLNGDEITINNAINLDTDYTAGAIEVTGANIFTVDAGSTLAMTGGISGTGSININGKIIITEGGFTDIEPTYGAGSTLEYRNIVAAYNRFNEWSNGATLGAGVPDNVIIENATLDLTNGAQATFEDFTVGSNLTLLTVGNIIIDSNESLTVGGDFNNSDGNLSLNSVSDDYSSLIVVGTATGNATYNRYVNSNAPVNGNDLISAPVTGQAFNVFIANNTNILTNPSGPEVLFGGFDSNDGANPFELWIETDTTPLEAGKGYRTGITTGAGSNLVTFEGTVNASLVQTPISQGSASTLNLVGNPFPSYLDAQLFLSENSSLLNPSAQVIYGYNDSTDGTSAGDYTIISALLNNTLNIAPGQAFFVDSDVAGGNVEFKTTSPDMRLLGGGDDFISGRDSAVITNLKLNLSNSTSNFITDIFFTEFSSLGLDPGYDASLLGGAAPSFSLYSQLVQDDAGVPFAVQALGETDYENVTVPLGVNANQGEQLTFSISINTLPSAVEVYIDDIVANVSTLLNSSNYVLNPSVNLNGIGRFYLRFTDTSLSVTENSLSNLSIYNNASDKTIIISGQLIQSTVANIYDLQGRLVSSNKLDTSKTIQSINADYLSTGIYIVQLNNNMQDISKKLIIR
ncbi:T9SS-dependent choice-of-anchor J family protein [Winogradskyella sp. PG-2]|uniref:T9SS-dependent choice-of-anchor J family protein n=1 Tax=Winogradskyella sp. PG-2 TaxID=754409 RepID=UPI0004585E6F|nr:choice-of-anchor J domain-containing protein [Winogradskyella sp. PG-2]BAO76177.1 hypothetical protein WPG_1947 [Winogradskyella sp. PG-2]